MSGSPVVSVPSLLSRVVHMSCAHWDNTPLVSRSHPPVGTVGTVSCVAPMLEKLSRLRSVVVGVGSLRGHSDCEDVGSPSSLPVVVVIATAVAASVGKCCRKVSVV